MVVVSADFFSTTLQPLLSMAIGVAAGSANEKVIWPARL
jgi:hypothetical protein